MKQQIKFDPVMDLALKKICLHFHLRVFTRVGRRLANIVPFRNLPTPYTIPTPRTQRHQREMKKPLVCECSERDDEKEREKVEETRNRFADEMKMSTETRFCASSLLPISLFSGQLADVYTCVDINTDARAPGVACSRRCCNTPSWPRVGYSAHRIV